MTHEAWIDFKPTLTAFGCDKSEWLRLRLTIMSGPIRLVGQNALDPESEPVDIPAKHLAEGIFELPGTLVVPGTPEIKYINVRSSQSDPEMVPEKLRVSQARETHRRGVYYFNEPRWPLHRALAWIAFGRPEALTLNLNELLLDRWAALRGYGDAAGLVIGNPADALLTALKAGELKAIDANHKELPAEFWDERSTDPRTWPEVRFRREDMLRLWPSGPDLRALLVTAIKDKGAMLTQAEAWKIGRDARANRTRDEVIELLKSLGGSDKPGPKGPRKNRAAPSA
jgi:hypothetical protein